MTKEKAIGLFNLRLNRVLDVDKFDSVDSYIEAKERILELAFQLHKGLGTYKEEAD